MRSSNLSRTLRGRSIAIAYLLVIGACIFVWPVVLGIPYLPLRFIWITMALCLVYTSAWFLDRSIKDDTYVLTLGDGPWWLIGLTCLAIAPALFTIPLHAFSDESAIALPAFTVLAHIARVISWPMVGIGMIGTMSAVIVCARFLRLKKAMIIVGCMAVGAAFMAWSVPTTTVLATRYPPIVHLFQAIAMTVGQGHLWAIRGANILWTILLGIVLWQCTPGWSKTARTVGFLALILSPMGWIYHTSLYQACGEITLGMCAVLLVSTLLHDASRQSWAPYAGCLFSLWMLYRPTAILAMCACILALWFMHRRKAAGTIAAIALPIACLWLALYPTYHYSFILNPLTGALFPAADRGQLWLPIVETAKALPGQFHPLVIGLLIALSLIVFLRGSKAWRLTLGTAWLIGLSTTMVQQWIQLPVYWGYPRFSILLLLPLSIGCAGFCSMLPRQWNSAGATILLAMLVAITPFHTVTFAHRARIQPKNIFQTTTGGDAPLPVVSITADILRTSPDAVFLMPESAYLDLFIASGLLTVSKRTQLLDRSKAWTPASMDRPVIIQAPTVTTYGPNVSAESEQRLRSARTWAETQAKYDIVTLGSEDVVIVY